MSIKGDLTTLDLTSLFQNLEGARKTGLLTVGDGGEETRLFFEKGQLALVAYAKRASLAEYLADGGVVAPEAIEAARKQRRRGRGIGAGLVAAGAITAEDLAGIARARLTDEACELLAAGAAKFEFAEVESPPDEFDEDERALAITLPASPLLLESARRSDHWALIREHLPSDSTHYALAKPPRVPSDAKKAKFQESVVELLDGSRTVREVVARFPTRRFDVYELLAELAKTQTIRPIPVADLNKRIQELARRDRPRALALLERGLQQNPRHLALLCTKALLAEKAGDLEAATEALKLVVHLELENDDHVSARATLKRLKTLDESDPYPWERSFELALEEGRKKDAMADGRALIELYKRPGQHKKIVGVLEQLGTLEAPSWELVRELARARAEAGERDAAVKGLERYAANLIGLESYPLACKAYEEILALHPTRVRAKETLQDLKSGALAQTKARRRSIRRRAIAGFLVLVVLPWMAWEALARRAFVETTRLIVQEGLLESGRYAEARQRYVAMRESHPWTTTAAFDVDPLIEALGARVPPAGP
jgi:tetratricopeptide (TPR) repeat protein